MRLKSSLLIASAIMLGTASFAFSQSAQYDYTEDQRFSYGPLAPTRAAPPAQTSRAVRAQQPVVSGPCNQNDDTQDQYLSYNCTKK